MKSGVKKLLITEILMLVVILISFLQPALFTHDKYLIFLCVSFAFVYFAIGIDIKKPSNHKEILKSLFFYLIIYFLFIYLLGLFISFARTIYSWSIVNFVKNIIPVSTVIIASEVLRYQFIKKSNNNKLVIFMSFLVFVMLDISIGFTNYNLADKEQLYKFIAIVVIDGISRNVLMTIFAMKSDFYNGIVYRLIMELYIYIVPFVPNMGTYVSSVFMIVLPTFISFMLLNNRMKKLEKPKNRHRNNIVFGICLVVLLSLVGLNSGFFKYQSLVIGSNSMLGTFEKGDVVILKKLRDTEKSKLEVGDIIVFRHENKLISHRIYKVYERQNYRFYSTKGDNNDQVDAGVVGDDDVLGKVIFIVDKVGLPSIWLNEMF